MAGCTQLDVTVSVCVWSVLVFRIPGEGEPDTRGGGPDSLTERSVSPPPPLTHTHTHCHTAVTFMGRKIRLIEGNAKCRHLKKLTCKGTSRQVFICLRPRTPYFPLTHCIRVYSIRIHTGKWGWGRVEPESSGVHKAIGQKYQP